MILVFVLVNRFWNLFLSLIRLLTVIEAIILSNSFDLSAGPSRWTILSKLSVLLKISYYQYNFVYRNWRTRIVNDDLNWFINYQDHQFLFLALISNYDPLLIHLDQISSHDCWSPHHVHLVVFILTNLTIKDYVHYHYDQKFTVACSNYETSHQDY